MGKQSTAGLLSTQEQLSEQPVEDGALRLMIRFKAQVWIQSPNQKGGTNTLLRGSVFEPFISLKSARKMALLQYASCSRAKSFADHKNLQSEDPDSGVARAKFKVTRRLATILKRQLSLKEHHDVN